MSAQLGLLVCACVQGTPLFFFFRLWKKKPNNPKPVFLKLRKKEKAREREREREEKSNREESLSKRLSQKTLSPSVLCLPSSLKATKRLKSFGRRRGRRRSSSSSSWRRKNEGTRSKTSDRGRLSRSSRRAGLCPKTRSRRSARCRPR